MRNLFREGASKFEAKGCNILVTYYRKADNLHPKSETIRNHVQIIQRIAAMPIANLSPISRRAVLGMSTAAASFALIGQTAIASQQGPVVTAFRNPGCGCCEKWAGLMKDAGFAITMEDDPNLADRKAKLGIPEDLAGCHTALIGNHIIEGHVPPEDIKRFLAEKSSSLGLAVPGMPAESPGMEMGGTAQAFDVMVFEKVGSRRVYVHYR